MKAVEANDTQKNLTDLVEEDIEIADVEVGEKARYQLRYTWLFNFCHYTTAEGKIKDFQRKHGRRINAQ